MVLELVTGVKGYLWDIILPLLEQGSGAADLVLPVFALHQGSYP